MGKQQFKILVFLFVLALALMAGDSLGIQDKAGITKSYQKAFEISYKMTSSGKYSEAIKPLMALHEQDPSDYTVALRLGYLNNLKGDLKASIRFYKRAVQLRPKAVEPLVGLILPLMAKMDYRAAVAAGISALKLDPGNYTCLSNVAYSYYLLDEYKNAAKFYKKILEFYPTDITMRNGLGWSYLESGEKAKAKKEFTKILLLSPYNQSALFGFHKAK